jgi:hypothetical protein
MAKREELTYLELDLDFLSTKTKVETDISSDCRSRGDLNARVEHLERLTKRFIFNDSKRPATTRYPLDKEGTESLATICASCSKVGDCFTAGGDNSGTLANVLVKVAC